MTNGQTFGIKTAVFSAFPARKMSNRFKFVANSASLSAAVRRRKLHIVRGCGKPRRLLTPLLLLSVKSHATARRRKLRIVRGCGKPRRLLTPLLLLSVKSHAAALLLACKRARDAPPCYQLFTGETRSRRLTLATNFLRYQTLRLSVKPRYFKYVNLYAYNFIIKCVKMTAKNRSPLQSFFLVEIIRSF